MNAPPICGEPVASPVMLVGQAPGDKEPALGRPFAWTAGKTLFRWFEESLGVDETAIRQRLYIAAVCRCFPGKKPTGGDRVPSRVEIAECSAWLNAEISLIKPQLVLAVGRLAINRFISPRGLTACIGQRFECERAGHQFDLIPLPHPSGASPWPRIEPGKTLLKEALNLLASHPASAALQGRAVNSNGS